MFSDHFPQFEQMIKNVQRFRSGFVYQPTDKQREERCIIFLILQIIQKMHRKIKCLTTEENGNSPHIIGAVL